MNYPKYILILIVLGCAFHGTTQPLFSSSLGLSWKSDIMNAFTFHRLPDEVANQGSFYPFSPTGGGGLSGFGLSPGIAVSQWGLRLEYSPSILYDALYTDLFSDEDYREVTMDQYFTLSKTTQYWRVGLGYFVMNDNKVIHYEDRFRSINQDIEYGGMHVSIARKFKKICVAELRAMYSWKGYPNNRDREVMVYGIRVFHEFDIR